MPKTRVINTGRTKRSFHQHRTAVAAASTCGETDHGVWASIRMTVESMYVNELPNKPVTFGWSTLMYTPM